MKSLFKQYANEITQNDLFDQQQPKQLQGDLLNEMNLNELLLKNIENRIYAKELVENLQEKLEKNFLDSLDNNDETNEKSNLYFEFNTDTKLKALGDLNIWQFTAICILSLILLAIVLSVLKKFLNVYAQRRVRLLKQSNKSPVNNEYFNESSDKLIIKCDTSSSQHV